MTRHCYNWRCSLHCLIITENYLLEVQQEGINVTCGQVGSSFGGMDYCDLFRRFNGFNRSEQAAEVRELRSVEFR